MAARKKGLRTVAAFVCVYFFWGSAFVANRYGVQRVQPAVLAGLRYVVAGALLLGYVLLRRRSTMVCARDLRRLTGLGIIMFTCNTVLLGYGSQSLSAGMAAIVIATIPLFIAVFESFLPGGSSMGALGWAGTAVGFLGLGVLSYKSLQATTTAWNTALGFGALLIAALAWAAGSVLTRRTVFQAETLVCVAWQMLIGGAIDLAIGLASGGFRTSQFTVSSLSSIAYLTVFGTLAGFTSYVYLLRNVRLAVATTYAYVNPIVAALLGWLFLGEALTGGEWIGVLLVLVSVMMVLRVGADKSKAVAPSSSTRSLLFAGGYDSLHGAQGCRRGADYQPR